MAGVQIKIGGGRAEADGMNLIPHRRAGNAVRAGTAVSERGGRKDLHRVRVVNQPAGPVELRAAAGRIGRVIVRVGAGAIDGIEIAHQRRQRRRGERVVVGVEQFLQAEDIERLGVAVEVMVADSLEDGRDVGEVVVVAQVRAIHVIRNDAKRARAQRASCAGDGCGRDRDELPVPPSDSDFPAIHVVLSRSPRPGPVGQDSNSLRGFVQRSVRHCASESESWVARF